MYLPVQFRENDRAVLVEFLRAHPFGLCVSNGPSGLQASGLPFLTHEEEGELVLRAHVARGNAQWRDLEASGECLVVVQGMQAYVSPSWYPTKQQTHEHVPTWNYDMVQLRGSVSVITDQAWLLDHVTSLTDEHEQMRDQPWQVSQAPKAYLDTMLKSIVGFELRVTEVQGKWKMNQNRLDIDAEGAYRGLADPADPHHNAEVAARVYELNHRRFQGEA